MERIAMDKDELAALDDLMLGTWNDQDIDAFLSHCADDIVWHDVALPEPLRGKEAAAQYFQGWMTAFPDFHANPINRVIGEDSVAVEVVFGGTNTGPLQMGEDTVPATGKTVSTKGAYFAIARDGKLAEMHTYPDLMGMMMQLGLAG
jgi:steroid delta-isomerase-like uncharacterized protein